MRSLSEHRQHQNNATADERQRAFIRVSPGEILSRDLQSEWRGSVPEYAPVGPLSVKHTLEQGTCPVGVPTRTLTSIFLPR